MKKIIILMLIVSLSFNICAYGEGEMFSIDSAEVNYLSGVVVIDCAQPLFAPSVNKNTVSLFDNEGSKLPLVNASYENSKVLIVPEFALDSAQNYSVVFSSDIVLSDMTPISEQTVVFSTTMKNFEVKSVEFNVSGDSLQLTVKAQNLDDSDAPAVLAVTMLGAGGMIEKCSLFPMSVTASDSDWEETFSVTPGETIQTVCAVVINNETIDNAGKISSSYKWIKE